MDEEGGSQPVSEEQRKKVLNYLQALFTGLKECIEETRAKIKQNEDDFDHITNCLQGFKDKSTLLLADLAVNNFNEQIKLEDQVFEWQKQFKQDIEVYSVLQSNVQLLTDWKTEMKIHIAKSPLIKNTQI